MIICQVCPESLAVVFCRFPLEFPRLRHCRAPPYSAHDTDISPAFFLQNNPQNPQQSTVYYRQHGNEPEPTYSLRYLDPAQPTSRNRYGAALYDPYVADIVYGEVAVIPEWTQPSLSADTIRANGGAAPLPEPILPLEFTIQLYSPDQQIIVRHHTKSWNRTAQWEFEMPQRTFRVPSASTLDRTQSDPAAADITPKLKFSWRKDGKLSKDLSCLLHGKSSTIPDTRTKSREPDITVALFQNLRELTLYEPNLYRVEMEDFKGLEVALLLAAVAIRDIFFGPAREVFHISSGGSPLPGRSQASPGGNPQGSAAHNGRPSPPRLTIPSSQTPNPQARRRQDELAAQEARRTQELLAAEERAQKKERRKREAEIEKETQRLQQLYGKEEQQVRQQKVSLDTSPRPFLPPRPSGSSRPPAHQYSQSYSHLPSQAPPQPRRHSRPVPTSANSPYLYAPNVDPRTQSSTHLQVRPQIQPRPQSTGGFPHPVSNGALAPGPGAAQVRPRKSSFFGLKRKDESSGKKLEKKRSSMF